MKLFTYCKKWEYLLLIRACIISCWEHLLNVETIKFEERFRTSLFLFLCYMTCEDNRLTVNSTCLYSGSIISFPEQSIPML